MKMNLLFPQSLLQKTLRRENLFARLPGLKMGTDIARGPEDWAIYVVVGSVWIK